MVVVAQMPVACCCVWHTAALLHIATATSPAQMFTPPIPMQALDRAFNTFVPLLYVMWTQVRGTTGAPATAALVLDALAFLHFARSRNALYADLVQVRRKSNSAMSCGVT